MPAFPWLAVGLLAFWCLVVGVFVGQFLPLPPMPRGALLLAVVMVLALATGRAVWTLRLAVRAWVARATGAERPPPRSGGGPD